MSRRDVAVAKHRQRGGCRFGDRDMRHCDAAPFPPHGENGYAVAMYKALTDDIEVRVEPSYLADRSEPKSRRYFWAYAVEIANHKAVSVQLVSRHWVITDGEGRREEVRGQGVVGEQPIVEPGGTFRYVSGCPLTTPSGIMAGSYRMVDETGRGFDVTIPPFSLDTPDSRKTLN